MLKEKKCNMDKSLLFPVTITIYIDVMPNLGICGGKTQYPENRRHVSLGSYHSGSLFDHFMLTIYVLNCLILWLIVGLMTLLRTQTFQAWVFQIIIFLYSNIRFVILFTKYPGIHLILLRQMIVSPFMGYTKLLSQQSITVMKLQISSSNIVSFPH